MRRLKRQTPNQTTKELGFQITKKQYILAKQGAVQGFRKEI